MDSVANHHSVAHKAARLTVVLVVILSHVALGASPAEGDVDFWVNSTSNSADVIPGNGICDTGGLNSQNRVECTLRAAIEEANALTGMDSILFDIPSSDPGRSASPLAFTIRPTPTTSLPVITAPVILDGTSQAGFVASPVIVIDGGVAGSVDGIVLGASDSEIRGLVVQNYDDSVAGAGIVVTGNDNVIAGNYVGTDVTGMLDRGNDDGVLVYGNGNTIGGTNVADRNVFLGGTDDGISIDGGDNNVILGNYVGVNAAGTGTVANLGDGIAVQFGASGNIVGGSVGNVISGNFGPGIRVRTAGTDGTSIRGNLIGVSPAGNAAMPNGTYGIYITDQARNTTIGLGNTISGNTSHGVFLTPGSDGTAIVGNRIGTDSSGTVAIPNGGDGVFADADDTTIGGSGSGEGNVISGNIGDGLRLERLNQVARGNLIGTDITGSLPLGNGGDGIDTGSGTGGSVIGGTTPGAGNVIAYNGDRGIALRWYSSTSGAILGNSIFSNGELGIDLQPSQSMTGVTPNDPGDLDAGPPNDLLNFPVLNTATETLGTVTIDFDLDVPAGDYRIEFFANPTGADPIGYGEGETLVSAVTVAGPASGFTHSYSGSAGDIITATTTRVCSVCSAGFDITSEFSEAFTVVVGNNPPLLDALGPQIGDELTLITFTATASDPDSDGRSFSLFGEPPDASIGSASGVFSWTPTEAQGPGVYTFDVIVTDDGTPNLSDSETITVTVNETNIAPILDAVGDRVVTEQSLLTFTASASDGDVPSNGLDFSLSGEPSGASIGSASGVVSWTPSEGQGPGVYTFDVIVTDSGTPNLSDSETITVTVDETNTAPILANPGDQTNGSGEPVTLSLVATDSDLPRNLLTWTASDLPAGLTINPASGVVSGTVASTGEIGRIHNVNITVNDGNGGVASIPFSWTIYPDNLVPTAKDDFYTVNEGEILTVGPAGILANDVDPDGDPLVVSLLVAPTQGLVSLNADGSFVYMHTSGTLTSDTFTYQVSDGVGGVDDAKVMIGIVRDNAAPVADDDVLTMTEDSTLLFDPLKNDSDPDGDPLALGGLTQPKTGTITAQSTGELLYTPPLNFNGSTTATYIVRDFNGGSDTGTIRISLKPVNDAPIGSADSFILGRYQPQAIPVLANDTDPDGDFLSIGSIGAVETGDVTLDSGTLIFTPDDEWVGTTTFTYTVMDPTGASDVAEVTVSMPASTLFAARALAVELGANPYMLATAVPPSVPEALQLTAVESVNLLAGVFFQTIGAFQLPLIFLALSLVTLVGLGGATNLPVLLAGRRRNHWSVVLRDREAPLSVYKEPSVGSPVIYNFNPTTQSILSTGRAKSTEGIEWLPVDTPMGQGWVEAQYLTEQVDLETFAEDARPVRLIKDFAQRLRAGDDVTSLTSKRGMVLALTGPPTQLAPDQVAALMGGRRFHELPAVGGALHDHEVFHFAVGSPFLAALDSTERITSAVAHSQRALIPSEVWNFRYVALGEGTSQPWLVFFEYQDGKPRIVGLGIDE